VKLFNKQVMLLGLESVYATDPALDATKAILYSNGALAPFAGSVANRQRAYASFGSSPAALVGVNRTLSFDVEMSGAGAAGTPPPYAAALRMCGLEETVTEDTKVEYAPVSSAWESAADYFIADGLKHKLLGMRGELGMKFDANQIPIFSIAGTGLFSAATDVAFPDVAATLADFVNGLEVNKANTQFTLHGYAAPLVSLSIQLGNKVQFQDKPNASSVDITDRAVTGTVVIEAPAVGTKDFLSIARAHTEGALQLIHGTVAGNIVQVDGGQVQLGIPTYTNVNDKLHISMPLMFNRDAGDDDILITVK